MVSLSQQFEDQQFANGYALVDGVAMHARYGDQFRIPPPVLKRHLVAGQFVELRLDSERFSVHEGASLQCTCPSCKGKMDKPILRHEHPATLLPLSDQQIPSRGWGEDFWVLVQKRENEYLQGVVDNPLVESRLHQVKRGQHIVFHENHILAIHDVHRADLVSAMGARDLKELAEWLGRQRRKS